MKGPPLPPKSVNQRRLCVCTLGKQEEKWKWVRVRESREQRSGRRCQVWRLGAELETRRKCGKWGSILSYGQEGKKRGRNKEKADLEEKPTTGRAVCKCTTSHSFKGAQGLAGTCPSLDYSLHPSWPQAAPLPLGLALHTTSVGVGGGWCQGGLTGGSGSVCRGYTSGTGPAA